MYSPHFPIFHQQTGKPMDFSESGGENRKDVKANRGIA
jgi:hypothetical protein